MRTVTLARSPQRACLAVFAFSSYEVDTYTKRKLPEEQGLLILNPKRAPNDKRVSYGFTFERMAPDALLPVDFSQTVDLLPLITVSDPSLNLNAFDCLNFNDLVIKIKLRISRSEGFSERNEVILRENQALIERFFFQQGEIDENITQLLKPSYTPDFDGI